MGDAKALISDAFEVFLREAPDYAHAWMNVAKDLGIASGLDDKTKGLAYLAVLAVTGLESGIPFHVSNVKRVGASRDEVIGAILVGLPAAGNRVIHALPIAIDAYDSVA